ncbi:glycosyltransferase [Microbacterium hibisci]|uniref:glycosyltransferase n=1 Tax=Microbacterium hibisci TaxID=2036000 RepID=UPI001940CC31|nr:glycosyltransferase [Microbacterium hibisci]
MTREAGAPDPRRGILGRATGVVYWFLLVEACFLLAAAPAFLGLLLLERDASNLPLYALCLVPVGPAFSAAMSTIAARSDELTVWPHFWKAYVRNVVDVLWVWVPALALATVLGITIAYGAAVGVDGFFVVAAIVFVVILALWTANALVIASFFSFRARDIARLALYYLAARPLVTLGAFSYLLIAAAIVTFTSDWVLALLGVFFAAFAVINAKAMTADIRARFVTPEG